MARPPGSGDRGAAKVRNGGFVATSTPHRAFGAGRERATNCHWRKRYQGQAYRMRRSERHEVTHVLLRIATDSRIAIGGVTTNRRRAHHETQDEKDNAYPSSGRRHRGCCGTGVCLGLRLRVKDKRARGTSANYIGWSSGREKLRRSRRGRGSSLDGMSGGPAHGMHSRDAIDTSRPPLVLARARLTRLLPSRLSPPTVWGVSVFRAEST